jgi:phage gpG-like protein
MPINVGIRVSPRTKTTAFLRRLKRAVEVVSDLKTTFEEVYHPFMLVHMRDQFATGGRAGGQQWAGLEREPKYAAYKRNIVGNAPILRWPTANEQLYPSLTNPRGAGHLASSSDAAARFGTSIAHAATLDRGGIGPFGEPFPARPILALGPQRNAALFALLKQDILARVEKSRRPTVRQ